MRAPETIAVAMKFYPAISATVFERQPTSTHLVIRGSQPSPTVTFAGLSPISAPQHALRLNRIGSSVSRLTLRTVR